MTDFHEHIFVLFSVSTLCLFWALGDILFTEETLVGTIHFGPPLQCKLQLSTSQLSRIQLTGQSVCNTVTLYNSVDATSCRKQRLNRERSKCCLLQYD